MKWKPTICIECKKLIRMKQLRKKVRSELMYKDCYVHLACFKGKLDNKKYVS